MLRLSIYRLPLSIQIQVTRLDCPAATCAMAGTDDSDSQSEKARQDATNIIAALSQRPQRFLLPLSEEVAASW